VNDLRVFDRVAARSSFSEAARELHLSPSVVTRSVAALEKRLGVRLFTRTTRQCRLTQDGETFHARCRQILADIDEAEEEIRSRQAGPRGLLRISAPISFGRRRIAPIASAFRKAYPEVSVQLSLSDESNDLGSRESDLAIRVGAPPNGDYITRRLLQARRAVCAAPAYLDRHGMPMKPSDLAAHDALVLVRDGRQQDRWMFEYEGQMDSFHVRTALASTSGEIVHEWALAGAGIALKSLWDVEDDLASGRLVELLAAHSRETADMFLIYPDRRNLPARVRAFIDFLVERMSPVADHG
jgi:LysR family transcriptional regulator, transcriptional activator for dmlA